MLKNFLLGLAGMAICVVTYVLVGIYGWGLEPKSYWWIIGGSLFGNILGHVFVSATKE